MERHGSNPAPGTQQIKKIRSSTVEPVLGTLVNYLSMRRVNTRGLKGPNKGMLMAAIAYNLKKLLKWNEQKTNTAIMSIKRAEKFLCLAAFNLWQLIHPYKALQTDFAFSKS